MREKDVGRYLERLVTHRGGEGKKDGERSSLSDSCPNSKNKENMYVVYESSQILGQGTSALQDLPLTPSLQVPNILQFGDRRTLLQTICTRSLNRVHHPPLKFTTEQECYCYYYHFPKKLCALALVLYPVFLSSGSSLYSTW